MVAEIADRTVREIWSWSVKVGDLVKHPEGMINVSAETYSCGIIVKVEQKQNYTACHVWWRGIEAALIYLPTDLELISESPN